MAAFRMFLAAVIVIIAVYTFFVIAAHGWGLLPIFFGDIAAMTWPGQFNLDFLGFLLLSGLWVSWRHDFSPAGLALGVVAVFGGMPFLSTYLLVAGKGTDSAGLLLGRRRAAMAREHAPTGAA